MKALQRDDGRRAPDEMISHTHSSSQGRITEPADECRSCVVLLSVPPLRSAALTPREDLLTFGYISVARAALSSLDCDREVIAAIQQPLLFYYHWGIRNGQ